MSKGVIAVRPQSLNCVFIGLSITSTWGNGHATTYRALIKELAKLGHYITFLERDVPWYASHREVKDLPYCSVLLYSDLDELKQAYRELIRRADVVLVGSYVPEGIAVGQWVTSVAKGATVFYDIDTPVTLRSLERGSCEYLSKDICQKYDLYFSFTGGPTLRLLTSKIGVRCAAPLYCSVDPSIYFPETRVARWELGYLGTYAADRMAALDVLMLDLARQESRKHFVVAGPLYPSDIQWPSNVQRTEHLPASEHREFYNSQKFTLNLTRDDMKRAGYSPSVRIFEAAACGTPIITDSWPGLEDFYNPSVEILVARSPADVQFYLEMPNERRLELAAKARRRTLRCHTSAVRARQFTKSVEAAIEQLSAARKTSQISMLPSKVPALVHE